MDYLREIILDTLLEQSDQVSLSSHFDRTQLVGLIIARFTEEYLETTHDGELHAEMLRLKDENTSLWTMLEELKASDMANYSKEMSSMMDRKLAELAFLIKAKPPSDYKN